MLHNPRPCDPPPPLGFVPAPLFTLFLLSSLVRFWAMFPLNAASQTCRTWILCIQISPLYCIVHKNMRAEVWRINLKSCLMIGLQLWGISQRWTGGEAERMLSPRCDHTEPLVPTLFEVNHLTDFQVRLITAPVLPFAACGTCCYFCCRGFVFASEIGCNKHRLVRAQPLTERNVHV